ncbi:MAG: hypothetical protein DKM50_07315 [Candidatus Margulisiibacteriota bacterium]|nr:MAG: hypothetical protein A2X43_12745 [Candidatus Margulisbacteria bacterium GWD2_39_127]OGI02099.1 MAG: hypothetical protein A2X42_01360 [Candidatus Margulisbacteria bacterium GWF2_38_17]OGI10476.1 MAG: hypothetical protein A2X41_06860 [Candidatus Margulisbacteria bacterium GWE2_39_32]PZM79978.1 MAG: hypothetical protein DKM50_07315 [Candidatus Margulisiibacteriota bacterium]HAR62445.1 hypothetical protein [Candidatus Margulisiibacteriota bacterium]
MILSKLFLILSLLTLVCSYALAADDILKTSWEHYKSYKIEPDGRPLADLDREDIANGSKDSYLTFSETVSYVLFRSVWVNDKETFDKTWKWAYHNLMRKNIKTFNWQTKQWTELPIEKQDNLFAWRWTKNVNQSGRDGVIYYTWQKNNLEKQWRSGYDVAPDGDELIAGSLIFAHNRWGSEKGELNYLSNAKNILHDLWNKCVLKITPGEIDGFDNPLTVGAWFSYSSDGLSVKKKLVNGISTGHGLYAGSFGATYMGIGKVLGNSNLSETEGLSFYAKGTDAVRIIIEDTNGLKASIVKNLWEEDWENIVFSFSEMDSPREFNWEGVKNIMFQPEGDEFYIDNIILYGGKIIGKPRIHLVSNDHGQPWINISYYMPFLYEIFAGVDTARPWKELIESTYYDINRGSTAKLKNQKGELVIGNNTLVPDWFMYSLTGEVIDLPWAQDNKIDDYLCSWDAFRIWFFISLHSSWYETSLPENILKNKTYEFFKTELNKNGFIRGGYYLSGKSGDIRGLNYEYPGINGAYLAFFHAAGDTVNAKKIFNRMQNRYNAAGYWDKDPYDYYSQNWAWLGLAFYKDRGKELFNFLPLRR